MGETGFSPAFPFEEFADYELFVAGAHESRDNVTQITADVTNFAACLNEAARRAEHGMLLFLPADLIDLPLGWEVRLHQASINHRNARLFYGDYFWRDPSGDKAQTVRHDLGDITEREDWGPVWAVRVEWLLEIGGLDETHHKAAFYDLLLKSFGTDTRVHVGGPLAIVPTPQTSAAEAEKKSKLFFPGRGALGGFSYLFMDKETERHTEEVFYNFLKRVDAWLEGERTADP